MEENVSRRTFLATTALETFWDTTQPMLYLGEWCVPHNNRSNLEKSDASFLCAPLLDHNFDEAIKYIKSIYQKILPIIADWLNQIHHTKHSLDYWEIVIGSFLFLHIQTVYDRYARLQAAYSQFPDLTTIGLDKSSFFIPLNINEYISLIQQSDAWNLQLFTQLISMRFREPIAYKTHVWKEEIKNREDSIKNTIHYKPLTKIKLNLLWFIIKLRGSKTIALCQHDFSKKNLFRLMLSSGFKIIPVAPRESFNETHLLLSNPVKLSLRNEIAKLSSSEDFSQLILNTLVINMPMSFIENYELECIKSERHYPYFSKVIVGAGIAGETLKLWGAKYAKRGLIRVGMQHGGGYGPVKNSGYELMEHKCSDFYLEWGYKTQGKVIAAPVVPICEILYNKNNHPTSISKNNNILWVATEFLKYPSTELRHALGSGYIEQLYYDWQSKVLSRLSPQIFSNLVMRLRYTNFSDRWTMIQQQFPHLRLDKPHNRSSFYEQICISNLLLFDNLNSTYLYGFSLNIPSILFFDEKIWPIRDEIRYYFNALRDVGIYHNSPESAALMINTIGDDPQKWWQSQEVQYARKQFCDFFVATSPNWLKIWKQILLRIRDGNKPA